MLLMLCLVLLITGAYNAYNSQCHTLQCYTAEAEQ